MVTVRITYVTVRTAALVAAAPSSLVKTARELPAVHEGRRLPADGRRVKPGTSIHVLPPSTEISHCTVGVGVPLAAA